jgi:hypothetical protein
MINMYTLHRFTREDDGRAKEIFIKNVPSTYPYPNADGDGNGQSFGGHQQQQQQQQPQGPPNGERFASLVDAYLYHVEPQGELADGQLVQSRLELMDPGILARENRSTFKDLLKLARSSGMDINWDQTEMGVATIRMRV